MTYAQFSDVKQRVTIVEVFNHYVPEEKRSDYQEKDDQLRGPCILCCQGKRRELSINTQKNCFRTFCCNKSGNIFDFVAVKELCTVSDACNLIAEWFNLAHEDQEEEQPESTIPDSANPPLSFQLRNIDPTHTACKCLGVSAETLDAYGAGYYSGRGMFKEHVVIPIHNLPGELIAYTGAPLEGKNLGKWHYPANFQPDFELFNAHRVTKLLQIAGETPLLTREPAEVLRFHDLGYPCALAYFGDFPTEEQLKLLRMIGGQSDE